MAISKDRLQEILRDAYPSCSVMDALCMGPEAVVSVMVEMTVAEWRELSRNIVEEHEA